MPRATSLVFFLALTVSLNGTSLPAQESQPLRLPAILGDHMVLQRDSVVPLWGWAAFGAEVEVRTSWSQQPFRARAGADFRFEVQIPTPAAGGPHRIELSSGDAKVTLSDILIGEVWVCSGQSNMEMTVGDTGPGYRGVLNAEGEIAAANFPEIRLFEVANTAALAPRRDCKGSWMACSPATVEGFSATAYFFGRRLHRDLDVPVGLISADWGGTVCEAWTSRDTLQYLPDFATALRSLAAEGDAKTAEAPGAARRRWWEKVAAKDSVGLDLRPEQPGSGGDGWADTELPARWSTGSLRGFDGVAWYRKTVQVPAEWSGQELQLDLGPIDDMDTTFWNGKRIGGNEQDGRWQTPRSYKIPADAVTAGEALIAVRVIDTGGEGGLCGEPGQLELRPTAAAVGAGMGLAGVWKVHRGTAISELGAFPAVRRSHRNSPTALWNGMIAPLIPFSIRGAIWYQGESNRLRAEQYRYLFPQMIADWRRHWGQGDFPFYFVQIAPFHYDGDTGEAAMLREAQSMALTVPETGMAVTMDIGNRRDIHPKNKQAVGDRLALWALSRTYGRELAYSGPLYDGMTREGDSVRVAFAHGEGLAPADEALTEFELCGEDGVFHAAQARVDGNTVVVRCRQVTEPVAVRFAWSATAEPNLRNADGLPAAPFRSGTR